MSRGFLYLTIILLISCGKGNNTGKIAFSTTDQDSIMNLHDHEELNLFITPTGHITTSILVNGKPCLFMIDTGAGHVAGIAPVVHPADEHLAVAGIRPCDAGIVVHAIVEPERMK